MNNKTGSGWVRGTAWVLAVVFVALMSPAYGQSYDPAEELPKPTDVQRAFTKLGRGLSNILLGWAEIPLAMDRAVKERKDFGYFIATAPVLGTARAFMRTGAGVFEVVTFPFSDRDVNYEAVLEPEYIF